MRKFLTVLCGLAVGVAITLAIWSLGHLLDWRLPF